MALAKAKNLLRGYTTPKPTPLSSVEQCIRYDLDTADNLLAHLRTYGGSIQGQTVLELGPGSDLGVGMYLVAKGAANYIAIDRHPLAANAPTEFYSAFGVRLKELGLVTQPEKVRFVADKAFNIADALAPATIDVVFSNAAFEHFDDVTSAVEQLSSVVRPGGQIVAVIDLQTHSRWIRDADPNNIYRYPDWLYRLFYFPGQPNRMRPAQYLSTFEALGWTNVKLVAATRMPRSLFRRSVNRAFRDDDHLDCLSVTLCATR